MQWILKNTHTKIIIVLAEKKGSNQNAFVASVRQLEWQWMLMLKSNRFDNLQTVSYHFFGLPTNWQKKNPIQRHLWLTRVFIGFKFPFFFRVCVYWVFSISIGDCSTLYFDYNNLTTSLHISHRTHAHTNFYHFCSQNSTLSLYCVYLYVSLAN